MTEAYDLLWQAAAEVGKVAAGFAAGVILKKTFWRRIIRLKKWIANDVLTLSLLAVRQYPQINFEEIDMTLFDHIKTKIQNVKLVAHHGNGMIIYVPPYFGNLVIEVESSDPSEGDASTKMVLRTENTIRLGVKEIKKINEFEKYADMIFDTIQAVLFAEQRPPKQSFAVCDISRTITLVEQRIFDLRDSSLNARVQAIDGKLTITTSPIANLAEATGKHYFS